MQSDYRIFMFELISTVVGIKLCVQLSLEVKHEGVHKHVLACCKYYFPEAELCSSLSQVMFLVHIVHAFSFVLRAG